jgi:Protein of unknown function (DUF3365)
MTTSGIVQGLAALATVSLLSGTPSPASGTDRLETGRQTLAPFQAALQTALKEGLAKGPVDAIDACRIRAPEIARELSGTTPDGEAVEVGRTSHKLRNPANAPRAWVRPLLAAYLEQPADRTPRVVDLDNGGWGYVQPIVMQPLCLTCHGETIAGPLRTRIDTLYPADDATGFTDGEFRGLFWAEFSPAR